MIVDGRKAKQLREEKGGKVEAVALATGLTARTVQRIESKEESRVNDLVGKAWAKCLGVAVRDIT